MCLFPKLVKNPKYRVNRKNGGNVPYMTDSRVGYVPIGCGVCFECINKEATKWKIRLFEEIKRDETGKFVTLTFSDESLEELERDCDANERTHKYVKDNEIARLGVRRFLERWRKKHGKSVKHWLITELGTTNTERIHRDRDWETSYS